MRQLLPKFLVPAILVAATVTAYGASFRGWFLPSALSKPVSIREGSARTGARAAGLYFLGGRSHYGGGYRGGK